PRLRLAGRRQASVQITAYSQVERPIALGDRILQVQRKLLYVGVPVKREQAARREQAAPARQVDSGQNSARRSRNGLPGRVYARCAVGVCGVLNQSWIDDPEFVVLG